MESSTVSPRLANIRLHPIKTLDLVCVFTLVLVAFYAGTNLFSPVRFDREKIEVFATDGQVRVHGLYHYRNRLLLPVTLSLGLPFPVDAMHGTPSTYLVEEVSADGSTIREVPTRNYHGDVVFRLFFFPIGDKWIRIDYSQEVAASSGRYILLTTREWHHPLDRGEYVLHFGPGVELAASNYPLQLVASGQDNQYSFAQRNFYPSEDWNFSWRTKTQFASEPSR